MLPLSLLFSSDEQASHSLSQALSELEFGVECCPEIFSAVEKITSRAFDIIVSDWNEGLEAAFLLKTSRELKANHAAFTIAIADPDSAEAAHEAGADLVLNRPIVPDEVKYALLTSDPFLAHMKTWLPRLGFRDAERTIANNAEADALPIPTPASIAPQSPPPLRAWPSPPPPRRAECDSLVVAAESIFDDDLGYRSRVQTLFQREPRFSSAGRMRRKEPARVLPTVAIAVAFLAVGYVFSEPLYSRSTNTNTTVVQMWGRALGTQVWRHGSNDHRAPAEVQMAEVQAADVRAADVRAEDNGPDAVPSRQRASHIRVTQVPEPLSAGARVPAPQPLQVETQSPNAQEPAVTAVRVPESLKSPVQSATMRAMAARITPSLLAALEPVQLSEDLSRRLLLQKVLPSYPEKAIRARLQGPVVLQAFIARDGTIQDLKLIRGSLLLGQAAYRAVRQWRYQPYLINGRAVEAQTMVTVDFRLP
jgi:periplasmic protein TonB